jgi:hypothetical protein
MFIGQGLSLEARCAAQAERQAANTATAAASAAEVAAAEQASSASPPFFALSQPAEMDSIASLPTPASVDGTSPAIAGRLLPLVYADDFIEEGTPERALHPPHLPQQHSASLGISHLTPIPPAQHQLPGAAQRAALSARAIQGPARAQQHTAQWLRATLPPCEHRGDAQRCQQGQHRGQ